MGLRDPRYLIDLRARNAAMTLAVLDADRAVTPTQWQASTFPAALRQKIDVVHEGVDTQLARPASDARIRLAKGGRILAAGDEVVTFVNRNLEPHRGFHVFMRALPAILARRPNAHAVIVGGDETSYGPPPSAGRTWRQVMLEEVGGQLDLERVHFVGRVSYRTLIRLFQVSSAHVYLTYPFVLSWSMLDAMSAGALVIGSRTPPVEEVIQHGRNGILCDFFDVPTLADAVVDVLAQPGHWTKLRLAARQTIEGKFDLRAVCLPGWLKFLSIQRGNGR